MEMRYLGKSGLRVSELCLGAMTFGGLGKFIQIGNITSVEAKELINEALAGGINFFDTSDAYSGGASEEILGEALKTKRDEAIICSKVRFATGNGPNDAGNSRYHIIKACHASLKRLGTDYLDVYLLHSIDQHTPYEETMSALDNLVKGGKVRYIGCSNFGAWQLMKSLCVAEKKNLEKFITYQGYYSLLSRDIENEIIPLCLDQGLGIMVWSPLAGGYLSGKFRKDKPFPRGTRIGDKNEKSNFIPPVNESKVFNVLDVMEKIAENHNSSIAQVAINYIRSKQGVSSVVLGVREKSQLLDNLKSVSWNITDEEMKDLDKASTQPLPYPYWHHEITGVNN